VDDALIVLRRATETRGAVNACDAHKAVTAEVKQYLLNVPSVNEESITDYLVWKWRLLDSRFKCIQVRTHSHHKESKISGADFEMELWLVGRVFSLPLLFQAKKLMKPYDGYVRKLRYPSNSTRQLGLLLKYARSTKRMPFYVLYAVPDHTGGPGCNCTSATDGGVFVVEARVIADFANGVHGKRVAKGDLLAASQPFYCWCCCSSSLITSYLNGGTKFFAPELRSIPTAELPPYARVALGESGRLLQTMDAESERFDWPPVRRVATYDLRAESDLPDLRGRVV
jgi:hypothetical protein